MCLITYKHGLMFSMFRPAQIFVDMVRLKNILIDFAKFFKSVG